MPHYREDVLSPGHCHSVSVTAILVAVRLPVRARQLVSCISWHLVPVCGVLSREKLSLLVVPWLVVRVWLTARGLKGTMPQFFQRGFDVLSCKGLSSSLLADISPEDSDMDSSSCQYSSYIMLDTPLLSRSAPKLNTPQAPSPHCPGRLLGMSLHNRKSGGLKSGRATVVGRTVDGG